MNTAQTFLRQHWDALELGRFGRPDELSSVMLTPRFRASSHVVFLVSTGRDAAPTLVVKTPRLARLSTGIAREVASLRAVQTLRREGFDSIPRVLAYEDYGGRPLLVETALRGNLLSPARVRRDPDAACRAVLDWLVDVQVASRTAPGEDPAWSARLLQQPFDAFARVFPLCPDEQRWLTEARTAAAGLEEVPIPLVFEHGDLCHPNLVIGDDGRLGVIDWELAEPRGLPGYDLFLFLTYVSAVRSRAAESLPRRLDAFHAAFFGPDAWARPFVTEYADRVGVVSSCMPALFLLFWARYIATWVLRLCDRDRPDAAVSPDLAHWLRGKPYYHLWRHTLEHAGELVAS